MNLSSLYKAKLAAGAALALCLAQLAWNAATGNLLPAFLALLAAVAAGLALLMALRAEASVRRTTAILAEAASGRLDARVIGIEEGGVLGRLDHMVNRMLDLTEVFTKEADAAMAMTAEGRYFRHILTEGLVGEFSDHARLINSALVSMENRAKDFATEATGVGNTIKHSSQAVSATATELEATAQQMSAIAGQTSEQSTTVARAATEASAHVESVASAAEQVSAGIREVAGRIAQSAEMAGRTVQVAIQTDVAIKELLEAAGKIGDVVNLINEIAGQTNLLALNATIEAARAGEAGKGFAVVAGEVKNLANQTARATDEIGSQIEGMRQATGNAAKAVKDIAGLIGAINDNASSVALTTEQQSAAVAEMSRSIREVAAGVQTVASTIGEVAEIAGTATDAAGQVLVAAGDLAQRTNSMNDDIDGFVARVCQGARRQ